MAELYGYFQTKDNLSIRYARFSPYPSPPVSTVVLLGGRAEFIEKHEETIKELNARQLLVYTFDWRGQGLSGRMLANPHKGYIDSFISYLDDLKYFLQRIVLPNAVLPIIILAHSMGGHMALRHLSATPTKISGAVLVSPMIDICAKPWPYALVRWLVKIAIRANQSENYIIGAGDYNPAEKPFKNNLLTSDRERFMDEHRKISDNPLLALGGATFGWLSSAFESIDMIFPNRNLGQINIPVLMVGGEKDRVISVPAMRRMCHHLPDCRCVIIKAARHEILKETDLIRRQFWQEFDRFIQKILQN